MGGVTREIRGIRRRCGLERLRMLVGGRLGRMEGEGNGRYSGEVQSTRSNTCRESLQMCVLLDNDIIACSCNMLLGKLARHLTRLTGHNVIQWWMIGQLCTSFYVAWRRSDYPSITS